MDDLHSLDERMASASASAIDLVAKAGARLDYSRERMEVVEELPASLHDRILKE